ncbi:ATP-binding protein [Mesorhizobium kowhaii]|nr:AAA family ATPase [Mesorhizobium kowhaii]
MSEQIDGHPGSPSARPATFPSSTPLPSGVVTFLLSDVEGSTRLWEDDEDTMGAAIARHYELLDAAITLHGGVRPVEQGEGDSVVGAFAQPSDAVAAALHAQRTFGDEQWPGGQVLRIRIALHTGEAQLRGNDYYVGRTVIRCARLRAVAHGGQTVLSGATRDLVADRLPDDADLRDLGSHRLKDLGAPERVWQLCHPDLADEFPPLRSLNAFANNLPTQLTSFVGRDAELAELRTVLEADRLVTLTGAGGAGKTRLAVHAAADVAERHPDGVRWVELAPVSSPDAVPYAVLRTFGFVEEEDRPPTQTLCEQLAGSDALVVLDNAEHVLEPCAQLAQALLGAAPKLRILVTSREPLGVPGELTWRVPSLDDAAATRLFSERASQVRPGFQVEGSEGTAVAQICRRLDGLPLAIELAAARVRMMPPARIAAALDDRFRLLTGGSRTVLPHQQTLETSVAWSHDLLDDAERAMLRRLSVFAGGFTLDAAEHVCTGDVVDRYAVLDLLTRLVDKSLVQADVDDPDGRYWLLETIKFFARARLAESGETDPIQEQHRDYFLALAEQAEPELVKADGLAWLDRLQREWDNLSAAADWCEATAAHQPFLRLVTALTLFFELRSHLAAGGRWFARALTHDEGPSALRARALWGAAHVALYGGDFEALGRYAPAALAMAEEVGDEAAKCRALNTNGVVAIWLSGEVDQGRAAIEHSVTLSRQLKDNWALCNGLKFATISRMVEEDYVGLAPLLADFKAVSEALSNRFFMAWYHTTVGWVAMHRGDFALAEQEMELALAEDKELGGAATAGIVVAQLGEIEAQTGRYEAAQSRLVPFLGRVAATGDYLGAPWGVPALARLLIGQGAAADAVDMIVGFVDLLRPLGMPLNVSEGLNALGAAHLALGNEAAAAEALADAKAQAASISNPWLGGQATYLLGELARRRGELDEAERLHHDALSMRASSGLRPGVAESLEALAGLAVQHDRCAEAARLFGAASTLRDQMGLARWPVQMAGYDSDVTNTRKALGEDAFAAAWAEGAALSVDAAVA